MNRAKFFGAVRASVFGGAINQQQVDGMEALLEGGSAFGVDDLRHIA